MAEFEIPEFLEDQDIDTIHERMLSNLPEDIDISVGSHPYNLTRPVAYELAYIMESVLVDAISLIFPKYCEDYSDVLDDHAQIRGLVRKPAESASGVVTVTGTEGTVIEEGEIFETYALDGEEDENAVVEFEVVETATIPAGGTVDVNVVASEAGSEGNVAANTVLVFDIDGVESITNAEAMTGGLDEESDEDLQERIMEYDEDRANSFVGSVSDYKRWAEEVPGVGTATVIAPEVGGDPVRIILLDDDGNPATQGIVTSVYNYIMGTENDGSDRIAPVNAQISVESPTEKAFYVAAEVVLNSEFGQDDISSIKDAFIEELEEYFEDVPTDGVIKYSNVCSCLSETEGIYDFTNLEMKITDGIYASSNIDIDGGVSIVLNSENITFTIAE